MQTLLLVQARQPWEQGLQEEPVRKAPGLQMTQAESLVPAQTAHWLPQPWHPQAELRYMPPAQTWHWVLVRQKRQFVTEQGAQYPLMRRNTPEQVRQLVAPTQLLQLGIEQAWHGPCVEYWPAVQAVQALLTRP